MPLAALQAALCYAGLMEDWNELKLVLAVARTRTLAAAARELRLDHSTVFRRLQVLESRLGTKLFERSAAGVYEPTLAGVRAASAAERIEDEAHALDREITGRDHRLSGRLRVTSSETLAYRLLTEHIAAFRQAHPGIVVEMAIDNRVLSLSRREADVALRPVRPREGDLWGRKLADVAWTVYAARSYLDRATAGAPLSSVGELSRHPLIGWGEDAAGIGAAEWLGAVVAADAVVYRSSSLVNQFVAAQAALGLAVLPCYLGDPEPKLVRALPAPVPELARELWIVTHSDLKRTARVRAFFDLVGDGLMQRRRLFEGHGDG